MKKALRCLLVILICTGICSACVACNPDSTNQQPDSSGGFVPTEKEISVSTIYEEADVTLDVDALLDAAVEQTVANVYGKADIKAYGLNGNCLQIISVVGNELSSVVIELPQEIAGYINNSLKASVLSSLGLSANQTVKESEKAGILQKISSAVTKIQDKVTAIPKLDVGTINHYASGETQENVNSETIFSVLGPVLDDGTFIRYDVQPNGDLLETPIIIAGASDKTAEEIYEEYRKGNYRTGISNQIDLSSPYTAPTPSEPENPGGEVEDEISFEEIYNQVFGEGFVVADAQSLLNDLAKNIFTNRTNINILAVNLNNEFTIYADNISSLGRKSLTSATYKGSELNEITSYLSLLQQIENVGGWDEYINSFAPSGSIEEGSETHNKLLATFENIKTNIVSGNEVFSGLVKSDFTTTNILSATREELPASSNAFGEALLDDLGEQGTIIATYVGDIGLRQLDPSHMFNTGYWCSYDIATVYQSGDKIKIIKVTVYNAWYTDSTNDSLYGYLLNGTDRYKLGTPTITTIENAISV